MSEHKPWCASVPRPMDGPMGRGPYTCDCGAADKAQKLTPGQLAEIERSDNLVNTCALLAHIRALELERDQALHREECWQTSRNEQFERAKAAEQAAEQEPK